MSIDFSDFLLNFLYKFCMVLTKNFARPISGQAVTIYIIMYISEPHYLGFQMPLLSITFHLTLLARRDISSAKAPAPS